MHMHSILGGTSQSINQSIKQSCIYTFNAEFMLYFRGCLQTFFSKITSLWHLGGKGLATWRLVCQQNVGTNDTVWHRASGESRYNHPTTQTTQYEQFIERYYGRHKGSGKSNLSRSMCRRRFLKLSPKDRKTMFFNSWKHQLEIPH